MHYIGLDLSMTNTGLVVLDDKAQTVVEVCLKSKPGGCRYARIEGMLGAVQRNIPQEGVFMVEGYAFGAKGQVFDIAEMCGVIKYHINRVWYTDPIFYQVPPTVLKQFVTGKGTAGKELMLKEVYKKYGKDYADNNIADAYGLAMMGWSLDNSENLTQYQHKALQSALTNNRTDKDGHFQLLQKKLRPSGNKRVLGSR